MNKLYISLSLALACSLSATAQSKLDAQSQIAISHYNQQMAAAATGETIVETSDMPFRFEPASRSEAVGTVIILMADGVTADDIAAQGFDIKTQIGDQVIASATISDIEALAKTDLVKAMTFGQKNDKYLDKARAAVGLDVIHAGGDGLPHAFTGKGVVTGIYDTGCDPNHIAFQGNDPANSRVKRVWNFLSDDGSYVAYETPEAIKGFDTDNSDDFHGTHTLGCMAGSFNGRPSKVATYDPNKGFAYVTATQRNPFYGGATESDIVIGAGNLYDPNILMAVEKCIEYAESVNKPVVVNLSIGTNIGPHDGKDQTSRALEELGKRGIICIASGNEGGDATTIAKWLTAEDNTVGSFFYSPGGNTMGTLDIWTSDNQPAKVTLMIYDLANGKAVWEYPVEGETESTYITSSYFDYSEYLHFPEFDEAFARSNLTLRAGVQPANDRYRFLCNYTLTNNTYLNGDGNFLFGFKIEGKAGQRIEVVNNSDYTLLSSFDQPGYTDGSADLSISSMGCNERLLTVGAWNTRAIWGMLSGNLNYYTSPTGDTGAGYNPDTDSVLPVGHIASYSSYGTTHDGRNYPLVCAPGSGIVSAINTAYFNNNKGNYRGNTNYTVAEYTKDGKTNVWDVSQGTSMATPVVAGAIATWLEANPDLTTEDVVRIIKNTADTDQYTNEYADRWGAGKFNALKGLKEAIATSSISGVEIDKDNEMLVVPAGANIWEITVANTDAVTARVFNTSGALVREASAAGNSATVSCEGLAAGVYIINVNGTNSTRVVVK